MKMRYYSPSANWYQALPLGNGKIAMMVFGGKRTEKLCFNDATLWSGYPKNNDRKEAFENLEKARKMIFEGNADASKFVEDNLHGDYTEAYMPLGNIEIKFSGVKCGKYYRELDLDNAVQTINFDTKRTAFVSYPKGVAVYKAECTHKFGATFSAKSSLRYDVAIEGDILSIFGNAPDYAAPNYLRTHLCPIHYNDGKSMAYCMSVKVVTDGSITTYNKKLKVVDATYIVLYAKTKTGYLSWDKMPIHDVETVKEKCIKSLEKDYDYDAILAEHIADYKSLFDRQKLDIINCDCDTNEVMAEHIADLKNSGVCDVRKLIHNAKKGKLQAELINLLYDYGKFLAIEGSRGSQPLNLQGQWNKDIRPPWSSNLTTNINYEMNYWPISACNLNECLVPYYNAMLEIIERGKQTAKTNFNANGFACNHNVDIWRNTSPVKGCPSYMFAPLLGVWIVNEACYHKLNSSVGLDDDIKYALTQSALFVLDFLVEKDGYLVTCPSTSPELVFKTDNGQASVDYATSFDMSIIRRLFSYCIDAGLDEELTSKIADANSRLYPYKETSFGLNEWHKEYDYNEKGHRHFSPLYPVYPARIFGYYNDKELMDLSYKLYKHRLDNAHSKIGWSASWAICLAGRFHDKITADKVVKAMLKKSIMPNLFDFHPPTYFQIDGNFGFVAGINELLVYEENGVVELLPACIDLIKTGNMSGFVVNGVVINFKWQNGVVTEFSANKPIKLLNKNLAKNIKLVNAEVVENI